MIWPFKRKRKAIRVTCRFIALVEEIQDDTYTLVVCGAEEEDGTPLKIYGARQRGVELQIGQHQYVELKVHW